MNPRSLLLGAFALLSCAALGISQENEGNSLVPPSGEAAAEVVKSSPRHGEWVDIDHDGTPIKTFVVYPERSDNAPVVIIIHEIFGMSEWVRGVADALAAQGFIALAPDLLSGKGPNGGASDSFESDDIRDAIRQLSNEEVHARLDAVAKYAVNLPASTEEVGVVGYCWGGTMTFSYAAHAGERIGAAIVYYGTGPTDAADYKSIDAPVLGLYGEDDARVNSTIAASKDAMDGTGNPYETHIFEGAGHGFLRQQEGRDGANLAAAKEAWSRTIGFFKQHLGG